MKDSWEAFTVHWKHVTAATGGNHSTHENDEAFHEKP